MTLSEYIKALEKEIRETEKAEIKNKERTFGTWNNNHKYGKIKQ